MLLKTSKYLTTFLCILLLVSCVSKQKKISEHKEIALGEAKHVVLKKNEKGFYRLFVDGKEFYVWGAGLEFGDMKLLANHGANAFRTWRIDNGRQTGQEVLDEALENNLMVFMGIQLGSERHGYDYNNEQWVDQQKESIRKKVLKYKNHPALLGWGIGNELNLNYTNKKVWHAVNDISKMIHKIDGNHPTTTMLSGINKEDVKYIETYCSDIDFISIQMYGDIINLQERLAEAEYDGPYLVTEWGATGHWEVASTKWGAPIEQSSSEKANGIMKRFEKAIGSDSARCMGSFIFLWGHKQERTPTWYGLFTENNRETEAIDVAHYFWNNEHWPANRAPKIASASLNGKHAIDNVHSAKGKPLTFAYRVSDPDNDDLTWRFEVMREATDLKSGGDEEERPKTIENLVMEDKLNEVIFKSPKGSGAYRAFIYVLDGHNHVATANIPFYVD